MELEQARYKIRCELGNCKNFATTTISLARVGIKSQIHICDKCMKALYELIDKVLHKEEVNNENTQPKEESKDICNFKLNYDTIVYEQGEDGQTIKECWWDSDCQTSFYERGEDIIAGVITWNFCPDCGRPCKQTDIVEYEPYDINRP